MNVRQVLAYLIEERRRVDHAIAALQGLSSERRRPIQLSDTLRGRRPMSAAARQRISEAMRKRWAERKKKTA